MPGVSRFLKDGCPEPGVPTAPSPLEACFSRDSGAAGCGQSFPQRGARRAASSLCSDVRGRWGPLNARSCSSEGGPQAPRKATEKQPGVARFNEPGHIIPHICIARFSVHRVFTSFISSDPRVSRRAQAWGAGPGACCLQLAENL